MAVRTAEKWLDLGSHIRPEIGSSRLGGGYRACIRVDEAWGGGFINLSANYSVKIIEVAISP